MKLRAPFCTSTIMKPSYMYALEEDNASPLCTIYANA